MSDVEVTLVDAGPAAEHAAPGHPERPDRVLAISEHLRSQPDLDGLPRREPLEVDDATLELVHQPGYVARVGDMARRGGGWFDNDTYCTSDSYRAARRAVGAALAASASVVKGGQHAFSIARPPGHHATADTAMGFCLFNSAAVVAGSACAAGRDRVAIIDIDVHHGNGSQDIFWDDPRVLYTSMHQWPLYPGTGRAAERGGDRAPGLTLNVPLPPGTDGGLWLERFETLVLPAVRDFRPELVVVSAGFDAHADDPLAELRLATDTYGAAAVRVADLCAAAGIGSVWLLEGGYNLPALGHSVAAVLRGLSGGDDPGA